MDFNIHVDEQYLRPTRSTPGSVGFDLHAKLGENESVVLLHGESFVFDTGVTIEPKEEGWMGLVYSRSGLSTNQKLMLLNGVAVIDPDYRGTIHVPLINLSHNVVQINRGDRIAQLCFCPFVVPNLNFVGIEEMSETVRGKGGFGHTGF